MRAYSIFFTLIIIISFFVRIWDVWKIPVSPDVAASIDTAMRYSFFLINPKQGEQIYPQVLWILIKIFPLDPLIFVRLISLIVSICSYIIIFLISKRLFGNVVSLLSFFLLSISFYSFLMSWEARGTILGTFFLLLSIKCSLDGNIKKSSLFLFVSILCHITMVYYSSLPLVFYLVENNRGRKDNVKAIFFYFLSITISFLMVTIPYFSSYIGNLEGFTPTQNTNIRTLPKVFRAISGGSTEGIFIFFILIGILSMGKKERILSLVVLINKILIFVFESYSPYMFFMVRHIIPSSLFLFTIFSFGVVKFIGNMKIMIREVVAIIGVVLIAMFIYENIKSRVNFSGYNIPFDTPLDIENLKIDYGKIIYFDPLFITKGVGFFSLCYKTLMEGKRARVLADENLHFFLNYLKEKSRLCQNVEIIYYKDIDNGDNKKYVELNIISPLILSKFFDELNILEWWEGDYKREIVERTERIIQKMKNNGIENIIFSVGYISFIQGVEKGNVKTSINIIRTTVLQILVDLNSS